MAADDRTRDGKRDKGDIWERKQLSIGKSVVKRLTRFDKTYEGIELSLGYQWQTLAVNDPSQSPDLGHI